jgi:hypothetical protein
MGVKRIGASAGESGVYLGLRDLRSHRQQRAAIGERWRRQSKLVAPVQVAAPDSGSGPSPAPSGQRRFVACQ